MNGKKYGGKLSCRQKLSFLTKERAESFTWYIFLFGGSAEVFDLVVDIHPFGSQILKK